MKQKTLHQKVSRSGTALHSGNKVRMSLLPAPAGSGTRFRRTDLPGQPEIPASVDLFKKEPVMCSALERPNGPRVILIEHLMAALAGMGVDNVVIELDGDEPPFENGAASFILDMIKEAGIVEQNAPKNGVSIKKPLSLKDGDAELSAFPSDKLRLSFFARYDHPMVGAQNYSLEITPESFEKELAPARTFCFDHDVEAMRKAGLLKGADENSALVYGEDGLWNGASETPLEPVRHKILDLLGDLFLLGRPLLAHVTAVRSGHASHARFVNLIRKEAL